MTTQAGQNRPSFQPAQRVRSFGTTVFAEYTALAIQHNAVNLGQGFPNFPAPDFVKEAAQRAIANDLNQYARSAGHPRLINALANVYGPLFGRDLNPQSEIVITVGATEGIFATVQALVQAGDEVVLIEPFYDSYAPSVIMAGGTPVYVPLRPTPNATSAADWVLDMAELETAFTERTRLLIINTPQNPLGKVFSRTELQQIAALVQKYDLLVLSDEVYEWMTYSDPQRNLQQPVEHVRIATLPGMWERTISCSSLSKTYSITGWRLGYVQAAPAVIAQARKVHDFLTVGAAAPLQEAAVAGLELADSYYQSLRDLYSSKRDVFLEALRQTGLPFTEPQGAYYVLLDISSLGFSTDTEAAEWMVREIGVAGVPGSSFFREPEHRFIRFHFAKQEATLKAAGERLRLLKSR